MKSKPNPFVQLVSQTMQRQSLSLRKVARQAGLDPSFFSKVLTGKRSPPSSEKVIGKLARCLGLDPEILVLSTGVIPSRLRSVLDKPEIFRRLCEDLLSGGFIRMEDPPAERRTPPASREKFREFPAQTFRKSPELSEDLL